MCTKVFGFEVGDTCLSNNANNNLNYDTVQVSQTSIFEITDLIYDQFESQLDQGVLNVQTKINKIGNAIIDCQNDNLSISQTINPAYYIDTNFINNHYTDIKKYIIDTLSHVSPTLDIRIRQWAEYTHQSSTPQSLRNDIIQVINATLTKTFMLQVANNYISLSSSSSPPIITSLNLTGNIGQPNCNRKEKIPITVYVADLMVPINNAVVNNRNLNSALVSLGKFINKHPDLPLSFLYDTGKLIPAPLIGLLVIAIILVIAMVLFYFFTGGDRRAS